jgi:tetratricopeptide (TPR) repeat protein
MSNHEFWNELGNLYFMNGAYQPAIHAYLRSIEVDGGFGRSYGNLAMAFVQVGKYEEAIKLYRHSIALLPNEKEKAITWNRLGILYRQVKEYSQALEAYQRADQLDPHAEEGRSVDAPQTPLTVSMPEVDLDAILAGFPAEEMEGNDELLAINSVLELAEEESRITWFEGEFVPPNPVEYFKTSDDLHETMSGIQSEWRLAYPEEEMTSTDLASQVEEEMAIDEELFSEEFGMIIPIDLDFGPANIVEAESAPGEVEAALEPVEVKDALEDVSYENSSITESMDTVTRNETEPESAEYSQVEYPLMELSPAERNSLEMDIAKYKYAAQNNPRNYQVWEMLGDAYKSAGMYKEAIKAFQSAISINSTKPSYYYRLGLIYAAQRREAEAVGAYQRVLELDPKYAQAHASLASHYMKMGLEELAQSHIDQALNSEFEEESEYNRACLEAICGHNDRALELLEVALQSKQTYINWAQVDPDLDSLRKDQRFHHLLSTYATAA